MDASVALRRCGGQSIMGTVKEIDVVSPYFTPAEAAAYLRMEKSTLNAMRWRREGPNWRKHGGKVLYHRDALDRWSLSRDSDPETRRLNS
jgi:excisionase family DNA binding protein